MGGTIAVHADAGDAVRIVVVTDGCSTQYPGDAEIRARKEDEARRAAAELGVTDYVHLDLPDMRLDTLPHVEVNRVVEEQIRDFEPARRLHAASRREPRPSCALRLRRRRDASDARPARAPGPHVRADLEHRVDACAAELVRPELVRRRHRDASSASSPRSRTTRPSGGSTRIRGASARSARPRSSTARAAAASTRSRSCLVAQPRDSLTKVPRVARLAAAPDRARAARRDRCSVRRDRAAEARAEPGHGHAGRPRLLAGLRVRARRRGHLDSCSGDRETVTLDILDSRRPLDPHARPESP